MALDPTEKPPAISDLADAVLAKVLQPEILTKLGTVGQNAIFEVVKLTTALLLRLAGPIAAAFAEGVIEGEAAMDGNFERLAKAAIKDIFGVDVGLSGAGAVGRGAQHADASRAIGAAVLKAVSGASGAPGGGQLQPSSAAAESFITMMCNIALEGWLEGFIVEAASLGQIETFSQLDDIFTQVLGLGRLSRRVMSPLLDATVVTPFEWKVNTTYRPRLLPPAAAARMYFAGAWTAEQFKEECARQGWSEDRAAYWLSEGIKVPTLAQAMTMWRLGQLEPEVLLSYLESSGFSKGMAQSIFDMEVAEDELAFNRQIANEAARAYADGQIDRGELEGFAAAAFPRSQMRDPFLQMSDARRALNVRRISSADVAIAVKRNILSMSNYRDALEREGFPPDDIAVKELLLSDVIKDAEEAERAREQAIADAVEAKRLKAEADAKKAAERAAGVKIGPAPLAAYQAAVVRGIIPIDTLRALLEQEQYAPVEVEFYVALTLQDRAAFLAREEQRARQEVELARQGVSLAKLEEAVARGTLTIGDYRATLDARGLAGADIEVLVAVLEAKIRAEQEAEQLRREREAELARKGLSLSQFEQLVLAGLRTVPHYTAWLEAQGFTTLDAAALGDLLRQRVETLRAAAERRRQVEAELHTKRLSLAQLEAAVLAGVKTTAAYQATLLAAGYSADDQLTLTTLLEQRAAELAAAKARRAAIDGELRTQRISLAQAERAVRLELRSLDWYRAWLQARGYSSDDAALLADVLLVDLQRAAAVQEAKRQADAERAAPELTLAQLERAVRAGVSTLAEYQAATRARGFSADDSAVLVRLLELRLEQDTAGQARRDAVAAELETRELSLAKWEQAVKAGARAPEDYYAFLRSQGYSDDDAVLLVDLVTSAMEG